MGFQSWTLAPVLGAIALVVGCTQEASDGADANGGAAGSPSAGAGNDAGASGGPLAGARDDGGASGSSFAGAPGDGGESGSSFAGAPGEETTPSRLTCLGVLQCAGACPDENADACVEDCLNQTSESSQPVTLALVQCIADNECADSACIQAKCVSELSACVTDDASAAAQGAPSSGPTQAGSVPPELVGLWSQVGLSSGMSYEFSADGTTIQAFSNETNYGCDLKIELSSSGVTTVSGDSLIYHRLEGTLGTKTCSTITTKAAEPADIAYRYALGSYDDGGAKLSLYRVNEDGTLSSPVELHH
ncbi:MAG TPA: hypothetical protein VER11_09845 [Polyangiaceae bacterium]|nr:hypothetical protein [Polyangiaceae bacterium]